jgi:ankyrin repeat protein
MYGKLEAARILLEHGAPPNAQDRYKNSPLMMAATAGDVGIVRLLLDHKAAVHVADAGGSTPLHGAAMVRATKKDFANAAGLPVDGVEASINTINKSQPADKLKIVKLLLAKGAKPNVKNQEGITPIEVAGKLGTPEIVAALQSRSSSPPGK